MITESNDNYRLTQLLQKLKLHQINAYQLKDDFRFEGKIFKKADTYYVPLAQPKYRTIKALFEQPTTFKDNTFYLTYLYIRN